MPSKRMARASRAASPFTFRLVLALATLALAACAGGCQFSAAPQRAAALAGPPRSGEVYLIRGLLGIFSTGMDDLQEQLSRQGVRSVALQHTESVSAAQWIIDHYNPASGTIILVGHSLGADETITVARKLERANIPVTLLITLDPVNAGSVPPNVQQVVNYYRPGAFDVLPMLRGIPLKTESGAPTALRNLDLNAHPELLEPGTNHFSVDNNSRIQHTIVSQILSVCPPEPDPRTTRGPGNARDPQGPGGRTIRASMTLTPERP